MASNAPAGRNGRWRAPAILAAVAALTLVAGPATACSVSQPGSADQASAAAQVALAGGDYSAPLRSAIQDLPVATEHRLGYDRTLFRHWIDADDDRCSTRQEVLISEADDPVTIGTDCKLTGGRWFSYYDRVSWTDQSRIDIDHVVALAEAWDSGAWDWTADRREDYANDLGDRRTLAGVTDSVNRSKSDQDPSTWLPRYDKCRYLREWVAVKHRWSLTVDQAEKAALTDLGDSCTNVTITVPVVS